MAITLNSTDLATCEATTGWTAVSFDSGGTASQLAVSDAYDSREGTNCLEYGCDVNTTGWCGYRCPDFTSFDIDAWEFGCWFLLPKASNDEDQILASTDNALKIRLFNTGYTQWGEYYIGNDDTLDGGWIYLRCSGKPNRQSASFNRSAVIAAAVLTQNVGANNGAQKNGDAYYGLDWFKRYQKITLTGTNTYDLDDIWDEGNTKPFWGFPERTDIFYRFFAGLELGDGTNAGKLKDTNKYVYFDQSSAEVDYDITVENNYTLELGDKVEGNQGTYAINGVQWISRAGRPDMTIDSGGVLNLYACRIEGFGTIDIGGRGSTSIDIIKTDFFDNQRLNLKSTGIDMLNVRMHTDITSGSPSAGFIFDTPNSMDTIRVFNMSDGLQIRADTKIIAYNAGDNTNDVVIREGKEVILLDSVFSESKLKRVST